MLLADQRSMSTAQTVIQPGTLKVTMNPNPNLDRRRTKSVISILRIILKDRTQPPQKALRALKVKLGIKRES